jgi:phage FluMu protein Com
MPTKDEVKLLDNQMCETQEIHCAKCGRFLGFQAVMLGVVKLKCSNCKTWTTIDIRPDAGI